MNLSNYFTKLRFPDTRFKNVRKTPKFRGLIFSAKCTHLDYARKSNCIYAEKKLPIYKVIITSLRREIIREAEDSGLTPFGTLFFYRENRIIAAMVSTSSSAPITSLVIFLPRTRYTPALSISRFFSCSSLSFSFIIEA